VQAISGKKCHCHPGYHTECQCPNLEKTNLQSTSLPSCQRRATQTPTTDPHPRGSTFVRNTPEYESLSGLTNSVVKTLDNTIRNAARLRSIRFSHELNPPAYCQMATCLQESSEKMGRTKSVHVQQNYTSPVRVQKGSDRPKTESAGWTATISTEDSSPGPSRTPMLFR